MVSVATLQVESVVIPIVCFAIILGLNARCADAGRLLSGYHPCLCGTDDVVYGHMAKVMTMWCVFNGCDACVRA